MWRLLRWALNLAAAVSAVLFVGVCVLWVRGYFVTDGVQLPLYPTIAVWSQRGRGLIYSTDNPEYAGSHWRYNRFPPSRPVGFEGGAFPGNSSTRFAGFGADVTHYPRDGITSRQFIFPYWFIATFTAMTGAGAAAYLRRHRKRVGHCPRCGYDMRATPTRCPECGAVPAPPRP